MTASGPEAPRAAQRAADAKINLALAVTGRRADGFHTLRSVVIRLALHDDLAVVLTERDDDTIEVSGEPEGALDDNLVLRAAAAVRTMSARELPGLAFRLEKRIPIAAGLGGGSSDAAAALDLAVAAWGVTFDPDERHGLALSLGADVPFFASGHRAALVGGIGDRLEALPAPSPPAGILLVTPAARLSTGSVFVAADAQPRTSRPTSDVVDRLAGGLAAGSTGDGLAAMGDDLRDANDLWPAATALLPALATLRDELEAHLGRAVLMTGSGSTLLAIYASPRAASDAAAILDASRVAALAGARIIATRTQTEEPA